MSLLMQALRKAEAKKKQDATGETAQPESAQPGAPHLPAAPRPSASGELTLEVKEPTREDIAAAKEMAADAAVAAEAAATDPVGAAPAAPQQAAPAPVAESVDYFSSEVPPARPLFVAPVTADTTPAPEVAAGPGPQGFDPDHGFVARPAPLAPAEQAYVPAPVPAMAAPPAPSVSAAAPLPPSETARAPDTAARLKAGIEQQKDAESAARKEREARGIAGAVFVAKAQLRNRRPLVIAGVGLVLLAAAGAYGYSQFMRISTPQTTYPQPGQAIVLPDPTPVLPMPAPDLAAPAPTGPAAAAMPAGAAPAMSTAAAAPVKRAAEPNVVAANMPLAGDAPQFADARAPGRGRTVRAATATAPDPGRVILVAPPGARVMVAPARNAARNPARDEAPIEFKRNDGSRQLNPTLANAYQAFVAGDQAGARTQYQRVLEQEPDNRDALLGMAAVAVNRGNTAEAGAFYARLLELDPTDADAASGIASVQRGDPAQAESNLKKVLAASPQTGSAHFALGNVYAQQQRWPEAQQAYFQALGAAPANGDYAFNLAVSLDKLGQKKLALEAYQKALQLAQRGATNVNQPTVQTRVRQLQQEMAATPK